MNRGPTGTIDLNGVFDSHRDIQLPGWNRELAAQ